MQLERAFVIGSVNINGEWLTDKDYSGNEFEAPEARIFNISRGGFYRASIDFDDVDGSMQGIQQLTDALCAECPFAKSFGARGIGEGIVWKAAHNPGHTRLWWKTKGPEFQPKPAKIRNKDKAPLSEDEAVASEFAESVAHQRRIGPGLDLLREQNEPVTNRSARMFADWVLSDIIKEGWKAVVNGEVNDKAADKFVKRLAFAWFKEELERRTKSCAVR